MIRREWLAPRRWRLLRDRRGNAGMLVAGGMTMLIGASALAVDTGSLYLQKRRLQGIADAAALAAVASGGDANAAAQRALTANDAGDVALTALVPGSYRRDTGVAVADRFTPGAADNAAQIVLTRAAPMFFGRFLTGQATTPVVARATAARIDMAAFSIGSRVAAVNGGLPNAVLSAMAGADLGLTLADYNALVNTDIDLLSFSDALRTRLHLTTATFGETLATQVTLPEALLAMAAASPDPAAATALRNVAARVPGLVLTPAGLIDLGPLAGSETVDAAHPVRLDGYALLRALVGAASGGRQVRLDLGTPANGIASTTLWLAMGERPSGSPMIAIGKAGTVTVRTAQARLYLDVALSVPVIGIAAVRLPVYVELAPAQATLTAIACPTGRSGARATLSVTPGIGRMAIADIDPGRLSDFSTAMPVAPAVVARAPLVSVTARADVAIAGVTAQRVDFSADEVAARTVKTVSSGDAVQGIATSLASRMALTASVLGFGINGSAISAAVGAALAPVAPAIDTVLNGLLATLGIRLGQADLRVGALRCGTPMLVG